MPTSVRYGATFPLTFPNLDPQRPELPADARRLLEGAQERRRSVGVAHNLDYTRGVLYDGAVPAGWTQFINFGDAAQPFIKHEKFILRQSGSAVFSPSTLPGSPEEGEFVYTSATHQFQFWNGTGWVTIGSGTVGVASVQGTANQIAASPITGDVFVSLVSSGTLPGSWTAEAGFTVTDVLTATGGVSVPSTGSIVLSGSGTGINMGNRDIINVNNLTFNDPGPLEGLRWLGGNDWRIYESPNDLTTNSLGNLQIVQNATRRATFNTSGQLELPVATGTAPLLITSTTKVVNLNTDLLDGRDEAAFAGIADTETISGAWIFNPGPLIVASGAVSVSLHAANQFVGTTSNHNFGIVTNNVNRWVAQANGHFFAGVDNTYDIGASGATRPRNGYFGTSVVVGTDPTGAQILRVGGATRVGGALNVDGSILPASGQVIDFVDEIGNKILLWGTNYGIGISSAEFVTWKSSTAAWSVRDDSRTDTLRFQIETTGKGKIYGDWEIGSLGVFDSTDSPLDNQILLYHAGATNKWQAESFQLIYNAGDAQVQVNADNTSVAFLYLDPGAGADSPVGAPPTPVLKLHATHKAITVSVYASTGPDVFYHDGPSFPADFRHFIIEYSTDNFVADTKTLATLSSDKAVHGRLTAGTTYYYRARAVDRAGNASANSSTISVAAVANSDTAAYGVLLATEIAVDRLAAISANVGIITAGQLRNSGNTSGVNLGGAGGIPGTWTSGINFEAAAGSGSMTRYINFTATGSNPVFKHELFSLNADGSAVFNGVVRDTSSKFVIDMSAAGARLLTIIDEQGTPRTRVKMGEVNTGASDWGLQVFADNGNKIVELTGASLFIQDSAATPTQGVNVQGAVPGTWTRYLNLNGSGTMLKHDLFELNYDGSATFGGRLNVGVANINITVDSTYHTAVASVTSTSGTPDFEHFQVGIANVLAGAGAVDVLTNFRLMAGIIADAVTTARQMRIEQWAIAGGSIGTQYGIYVEDFNSATTNYAIYTNAGLVRFGGDVVMGAAVSRIRGGATSFAIRNAADSADNLIITNAGAVTFRSTVDGITTLTATTLAGTLSTAAQPNVTSLGTLAGLTINGNLTFSGASRKLIPGTTDFALRNNADSADNILIADGGAITFRAGLSGITTLSQTDYHELTEQSAPSTPAANKLRVYAKDKSGVSELYYKNDAGTERDLSRVADVRAKAVTLVGADASTNTTTSSTETDLTSISLPASSLTVTGDMVRVVAWGTVAVTGSGVARVRLYFGATMIGEWSGATTEEQWRVVAYVARTGAATQKANSLAQRSGTNADHRRTSPTETLSGAVTIKTTGQNSTGLGTATISVHAMEVELMAQ